MKAFDLPQPEPCPETCASRTDGGAPDPGRTGGKAGDPDGGRRGPQDGRRHSQHPVFEGKVSQRRKMMQTKQAAKLLVVLSLAFAAKNAGALVGISTRFVDELWSDVRAFDGTAVPV